MKVRWEPWRLRQTSGREYVVRFGFGGAITALAGYIAHRYGPIVGGLFLAFPAILPATVTLIEGDDGTRAAGVDAAGAVLGSVGLAVFAAIIWVLAARAPAWLALAVATFVWFVISGGLWWWRERAKQRKHQQEHHANSEDRGAIGVKG